MDPLLDVKSWRELRAVIDGIEPDIVHTHNPKPGVFGRMLARSMGVPVVVNTVHGLYAQPTDGCARRVGVYSAERLAASCSDAELVQNIEDVNTLRSLGVPADRVHLLGNGIDLDRFSPTSLKMSMARAHRRALGIGDATTVIGMVGRLVWEKGYREFFDAVAPLLARNDVAVVVAGPNEPGKAGAVDHKTIDVDVLLTMFDIFALPSYREGFPRSAMEASAMGVPVVATNIRGCRQVVEHDITGLLVESRSGAALRASLELLLADPLRRREMGRAGRNRAVREFDQQRVIARTLAVYRGLLRNAARDRRLAVPTRLELHRRRQWHDDALDASRDNLWDSSCCRCDHGQCQPKSFHQ
ncbi:UDP-Gal:alpha-D-GlcNAc-diphosphoundecaprenol alpha-1,3-galactosyltransferase-like [Stigmatopora argus]